MSPGDGGALGRARLCSRWRKIFRMAAGSNPVRDSRKRRKELTPTTLYEDYPISPTRFHWESQSVTRADSETGRRYQKHAGRGWRVLLFMRPSKRDERGETMSYLFAGSVRYVSHESEKPMRIIWELEHPLPP